MSSTGYSCGTQMVNVRPHVKHSHCLSTYLHQTPIYTPSIADSTNNEPVTYPIVWTMSRDQVCPMSDFQHSYKRPCNLELTQRAPRQEEIIHKTNQNSSRTKKKAAWAPTQRRLLIGFGLRFWLGMLNILCLSLTCQWFGFTYQCSSEDRCLCRGHQSQRGNVHSPLLPPPLRPVFSWISSKIIAQLSPAYFRRMKEELSWIVRGRPGRESRIIRLGCEGSGRQYTYRAQHCC